MNELTTEEIEVLARALNRIPPESASLSEVPMQKEDQQGPEQVSMTKAQYSQLPRPQDLPQTQEQQEQLEKLPVTIEVILGTAKLPIKEALKLHTGSVLTLNTFAGEPVEIRANGQPFATGEIVVVEEQLGIRLLFINKKEG